MAKQSIIKKWQKKSWFLPAVGFVLLIGGAIIGVLNDSFRIEVLKLEQKIKSKG